MNLYNLTIEELVEKRTNLILEGKSTLDINQMIDKKEQEYITSIIEDATGSPGGAVTGGDVGSMGVAFSSNTGGMGNIISAQPSALAGSTIGPNWSDNGGTVGSGDVSFTLGSKPYQKEMGKDHGARTGKKSRKKRLDIKELKKTFAKRQDYTSGEGGEKPKRVLNFNDFQKDSFQKVTKLKQ